MMSTLTRRILRKFNLKRLNIRSVSSGIIKSDYADVEIPNSTVHEYIFPRFEKYSKYTAIECGITGRKYTYGQLRNKCRNFSKNLRTKLKLTGNDTLAILLPNCPEYPIVVLGTMEAGILVTTLNPIYTPDEVARQLKDSDANAIVTTVDGFETVKSALSISKKTIPIITIKTESNQTTPQGSINFDEFADNKVDIPDFSFGTSEDLVCLPYSSGTTGLPKGVMLTHRNVVSNICQSTTPEVVFLQEPSDNFQVIIPGILPMFHIYGFTVTMLSTFYFGSKLITLPKFAPETFINTLENHKVNIILAAPPLVLFLTLHPLVTKKHLANLQHIMCGAAPLGAMDEDKFIEKAGNHINIFQGYGLTETSPVLTMVSKYNKARVSCAGSIGTPVANTELKIVDIDDPTGTPLGPRQQGELLARGPQVMKGYFNKPEETEKSMLDGWFKTGDLGYYNEDKLFYINDRLKELIKVKGFQVPPAELEEIIRDYPNVAEAAVIGVPHPLSGEIPRAYIVPKENKKIDAEDLAKFVAEKVAPYKQLKGGIEFVSAIPKNPSGKILRRELKLRYEESHK